MKKETISKSDKESLYQGLIQHEPFLNMIGYEYITAKGKTKKLSNRVFKHQCYQIERFLVNLSKPSKYWDERYIELKSSIDNNKAYNVIEKIEHELTKEKNITELGGKYTQPNELSVYPSNPHDYIGDYVRSYHISSKSIDNYYFHTRHSTMIINALAHVGLIYKTENELLYRDGKITASKGICYCLTEMGSNLVDQITR